MFIDVQIEQTDNRMNSRALILLGILSFSACEPTGPSAISPLEYKWAVDSVLLDSGLQVLMRDVWASSSTNAYAVGFASQRYQRIFHFDGNSWTEVDFPQPPSISIQVDFYAISGLSASSIWAVGDFRYQTFPSGEWVDSSFVLFFNGSSWSIQLQGLGRSLFTVHPVSPSDVWAGGWDSTMLHFDGRAWERVALPRGFHIAHIAHTLSGMLFATAYSIHQPGGYFDIYFLKHHLGQWVVADSANDQSPYAQRFGLNGLVSIGEAIYTGGHGVSRYYGGQWTSLLPFDGDHVYDVEPFSGGLLAGGEGARLRYHNGATWNSARLPLPDGASISSIWSDGNGIVMTGSNQSRTVTYLVRAVR